MNWPQIAHRLRVATVAVGLCLCGLGCWGDPGQPREKLPRLSDLRSRVGGPRPPRQSGDKTAFRTRILRIELPLDAPLERAWSQVDTTAVPDTIRYWWQRNGLRTGVLLPGIRRRFVDALPPIYGQQNQLLIGGEGPAKLSLSPRPQEPVQVELPYREARMATASLQDGHCQFLIRALHLGSQRTAVELTPHHHVPTGRSFVIGQSIGHNTNDTVSRPRILVRSPREKALDGRILDELTLSLELSPGEALVVGLDHITRHHRASPQATDASTGVAEATGPERSLPHRSPDMSKLPPHLGRALLTTTRMGRPIQMLLLIECPTLFR